MQGAYIERNILSMWLCWKFLLALQLHETNQIHHFSANVDYILVLCYRNCMIYSLLVRPQC